MSLSSPRAGIDLDEAITTALRQLSTLHLADQSVEAIEQTWARFHRFATAAIGSPKADVSDEQLVAAFVKAPSPNGLRPSVAAMHWRRSVLRLLFRLLRQQGLVVGYPTLDLSLPPRSRLRVRSLTDDEVLLCRWASLSTVEATRLPAVWALAETGARSGEIAAVRVGHVHLDVNEVALPGSTRTRQRVAPLSEWGATQLARRIATLGTDRKTAVAYGGAGRPQSAQASVSGAIGDVLRRAGLGDEPDIMPVSVTAWAGRRIFEKTERIEQVALHLGFRSLDRTAELIAWDWWLP